MHAVLIPGTILGTATGLTLGTTLGEIPSIITTDDQVGTGDGVWAGATLLGTVDTTGDGIWALAILLGIVDITGGIEMVSGMATIGALEITTMILTTEATTAGPKMYTPMEDGPTNQGSYNNGQRDNDQYASSRSSSSIAARNQYARGSYWSDSKSRSTDNSFSNNYGGRRGTSNERGIFSRNELGQVTAGGSSYDRGTTSREVFRQPRRDLNPDLTAQEFNRGISSSTRNDYQGGRGVFRTDRSFNSSSTPTRSREVFRSDRPSRNDYQGGRGVFGTDRSSNSSSTPTRSREVFRSDRPSRNDYQGGRGVFGTDRSSSSSSSTYSPSRSSSPSSDRSYGGGSRNSTGRR